MFIHDYRDSHSASVLKLLVLREPLCFLYPVYIQALVYIQDSQVPPGPGGIYVLIQDSRYIDPVVVYRQDRYPFLPLDYP